MTKGQCINSIAGLHDRLQSLPRGVSPGTGGLRAEFLSCIAENLNEHQYDLLEDFGLRYVCGHLPPWYYKVTQTVTTVPLFKTKERNTVRPLGIKNQLIRVFEQEVMRQNKQEIIQFLEPQQLAMSEAGGGKLVNAVRMMLEDRRDFVAVKLDIKNAFNEISRASIVEALEAEPSLKHLASFKAITSCWWRSRV